MRYVVLDTETTGLDFRRGDRVFEIGCVEVIDKKKQRIFHKILDPKCSFLPKEVENICKVKISDLKGKPFFEDIADEFLDFLNLNQNGEEEKGILVAHNAKFDIGFLSNELKICGRSSIEDFKICDTVKMSKTQNPGEAASLDSICKRMNVSLDERQESGHGALTDSHLLVDVFLRMIDGRDDD